jgi:holo-ACP synthase / triphosphoribosyl-dephospho-CoA synthase
VSLSLNVPGYPKSNPVTKAFFRICLTDLDYFLKSHLVEMDHKAKIELCDAAGDYFIAPCSKGGLNLQELKQICEDFEEMHPLGRFIDVDLNDELGNTVSSGKLKACFFCGEKPAIACRRSKTHEYRELRSFMFSHMIEYCHKQRETVIVKKLSSLALKAILYEISLTPKPGLVDKFSNGSHTDMNFQAFINSSTAISPFFDELALAGYTFQGNDYTRALPVIRNIGLRMESAMFVATGNVNTQKGIIFLMGLSLFACGRLYSQGDLFDTEAFRGIIKNICKDIVNKELAAPSGSQMSHGEEIYLKYGFSGARGEAESGFRTVFEFGLPHLKGVPELNDRVLIECFLVIAANNNDTNILYRRGKDTLSDFKALCKKALENFPDENYSGVIEYCKSENISPGGSADLLAVSIFVWLVMDAGQKQIFPSLPVTNDF